MWTASHPDVSVEKTMGVVPHALPLSPVAHALCLSHKMPEEEADM